MDKTKVLIIDDAPEIRQLLTLKLNGLGEFEISESEFGKSGIALFEEISPDIAFVDINLPDLDGFNVLSQIKSIDDKAFVVIISGDGGMQTLQKSIEAGANGFLIKPFSVSKIEGVLNKYRKSR